MVLGLWVEMGPRTPVILFFKLWLWLGRLRIKEGPQGMVISFPSLPTGVWWRGRAAFEALAFDHRSVSVFSDSSGCL